MNLSPQKRHAVCRPRRPVRDTGVKGGYIPQVFNPCYLLTNAVAADGGLSGILLLRASPGREDFSDRLSLSCALREQVTAV